MLMERHVSPGICKGLLLLGLIAFCCDYLTLRFRLPPSDQRQYNGYDHHGRSLSALSTRSERASPLHKLEFVHIAKTGGTAIVNAAADAGIMWAECHYKKFEDSGAGCAMPDADEPTLKDGVELTGLDAVWHVPLKYWKDPHIVNDHTDTFAVVRNPYDRAVSAYYCPWDGFTGKGNGVSVGIRWGNGDMRSLEDFNKWIRGSISEGRDMRRAKRLRQSDYMYDESGEKRLVDHIIYYESLQDDFAKLTKEYGLEKVRLQSKAKGINIGKKKFFTKCDMTPETFEVVNEYMAPDFQLFGYQMVKSAKELPECYGTTEIKGEIMPRGD